MTTTVLAPCAGCDAEIEVELPEDGSDETHLLSDSLCEACIDERYEAVRAFQFGEVPPL